MKLPRPRLAAGHLAASSYPAYRHDRLRQTKRTMNPRFLTVTNLRLAWPSQSRAAANPRWRLL